MHLTVSGDHCLRANEYPGSVPQGDAVRGLTIGSGWGAGTTIHCITPPIEEQLASLAPIASQLPRSPTSGPKSIEKQLASHACLLRGVYHSVQSGVFVIFGPAVRGFARSGALLGRQDSNGKQINDLWRPCYWDSRTHTHMFQRSFVAVAA